MSLNLAPYHAAMRIGQGFNSYTHEICMNDCVVYDEQKPGGDHYSGDTKQVSQIVTYCTRHVEKLSEITDAMNVSAALSIKTGSFGGGLSGSYVNSDKFKESTINFFAQVQVVNQVIMAEDVRKFNPIDGVSNTAQFTRVFGDCFISGFIEGGELDALISIKTTDTQTVMDIKAALEANFGKGGIGGKLQAAFGKNKEHNLSSAETTITVNWNGGGEIKPADVPWSIESLTAAAAAFPNKVAQCPQRTYAILTKYENLRTFQEIQPKISVLDYDVAALYTNDLLDTMMSFKNIWKEIHLNSVALEFGQITLVKAQPPTKRQPERPPGDKKDEKHHFFADVITVARERTADNVEQVLNMANMLHSDHKNGGGGQPQDIEYPDNAGTPYEPDELGLDKARKDCRLEMLKIVKEVDAITANPALALEPDRDAKCINPSSFRKLLPKVTKVEPPQKGTGGTGNEKPPGTYQMYASPGELPKQIKEWYEKNANTPKSAKFSMTAWAGDHTDHEPQNKSIDYDVTEPSDIVTKVETWNWKKGGTTEDYLLAYRLTYKNAKIVFRHRDAKETPPDATEATSDTWDVPADDRITAVQMTAGKFEFPVKVIASLKFTTSKGTSRAMGLKPSLTMEPEVLWTDAPSRKYSFKGFWAEHGNAFDRMGVFYAQDE